MADMVGRPSPATSKIVTSLGRSVGSIQNGLLVIGRWLAFTGQVLYLLPLTVTKYRRETLARLNGLAWGRGSLIVDGGVISVFVLLGVAGGASIAIEAFATLNLLGLGALSGIISGIGNVRIFAPLIAGIGFATQAGTRMTAEIGAMRIADEIDAVEAMGLRPIPFVVGTRLVGGLLIVIPGYLLTMLVSFYVSSTIINVVYGQHSGTFEHYFVQFLPPEDLLFSTIKAATFCFAVTIIHCYYGYFASGGPVGVGLASGRAVRASLVAIMVIDFILTVALWGIQPTFVFKG
jgi:phospholipid/cholesterol/gamma-HCH transport system permease protein